MFCIRENPYGKNVETLVFSDEDEIAQDDMIIQKTFASNKYDVEIRQEAFKRFLKGQKYSCSTTASKA